MSFSRDIRTAQRLIEQFETGGGRMRGREQERGHFKLEQIIKKTPVFHFKRTQRAFSAAREREHYERVTTGYWSVDREATK